MKPFVIFFLSLSFWSNGQYDLFPQAPNLTTANLKGSVRFIEETSFVGSEVNGVDDSDDFEIIDDWTRSTKYVYDSLGHLLRADFYRADRMMDSHTYTYTNGKLTECTIGTTHIIYEYDGQGRLESEYSSAHDDYEMPILKLKPFDKSNSWKIGYVYDASGNLTVKNSMWSDEIIESMDSIFYDEQNRPIKILSYYDDYIEFKVIEYDAEGNLLQVSMGDNVDGLFEKVYHSYDNLLREERWEFFMDNLVESRDIYYFENGNEIKIVEEELAYHDATITDYSYDFDAMGNWIKKTATSLDSLMARIYTRKIEYYE